MLTLSAEPQKRLTNSAMPRLDLAGATATIVTKAADIDPAFWAMTFGDQPKDYLYYDLLERTMREGFEYRYLVLNSRDGTPLALQPLIIADQDLSISFPKIAQRIVRVFRSIWSRFLRARLLLAGCLVGEGYFGVRPGLNRSKAVIALQQALSDFVNTEGISLIAIKDFPVCSRPEMHSLQSAGYTRLSGFPPLRLRLNFDSFEEYATKYLSRITRKGLRRKLRTTAASSPPVKLEIRKDCKDVIDQIYPLYLAVAQRSAVQFEVFTRDYFLEASRVMPERCRFFIWRQNERAVAFSYCTVWGDTIFDNNIGLDYSVAYDLNLYYLSFRDILEYALAQGYRWYRTAPFNYETKLHLGLELDPVDLFVRHRSPVINLLLRRFAPRFAPGRSDPVRRRHRAVIA